jgi:hypothetical protein
MAKDFVQPSKPVDGRPDSNPPEEKPFAMAPPPPPPPPRITQWSPKDRPKE